MDFGKENIVKKRRVTDKDKEQSYKDGYLALLIILIVVFIALVSVSVRVACCMSTDIHKANQRKG